jgi:hypothetical protein
MRHDPPEPAEAVPSAQSEQASAVERSLRARLAAYAMHAQHDARETTANGRSAFLARFEREVDPHGRLDPKERRRRAEQARRVYFTLLALASAKARRIKRTTLQKRREGGEAA